MFENDIVKISQRGLFLDSNVIEFRKFNFNILRKFMFGFGDFFFKNMMKSFEEKINYNSLNYYKLEDLRYLKVISYYIMKVVPGWFTFKILYLLNLKRYLGVKNYKGRCFLLGKPTKGQRT